MDGHESMVDVNLERQRQEYVAEHGMTYAQRGVHQSEVDVRMDPDGRFTCVDCSRSYGVPWTVLTAQDMIRHLALHRLVGERVPFDIISRLWLDIPEGRSGG